MNTLQCRAAARIATLVLGAALAALSGLAASPLTRAASAYVANDGDDCSEYDSERDVTYTCVPSGTDFYTPDGVDPTRVAVGTNYSDESSSSSDIGQGSEGIPTAAPYRSDRFYCSRPWWGYSPFEDRWNSSCYNHDVCYGSQKGRKYCDVQFWHGMIRACKAFSWYNPTRYDCFADAVTWYLAVRWYGASHYKPRKSTLEPAGEPR